MIQNSPRLRFLKGVLWAGGIYEIGMGLVLIFFITGFFRFLGAEKEINYLIFSRTAGTLAVCFGLLLLISARNPARYLAIILVSILLRVLIQFPILAGGLEIPNLALPLLGFGAFDLLFALLTGIALYRSGIPWRDW